MALTQISTGGVKNDAVTAGKIPADAVGQSEIADEAVDEARLQVSNAGTNGQFLSKQSGNTGGLTWADANSYTHPNHSGEVTSTADGAQVITDNVVDEANLKVSNSPTNGQLLSAQSGNTGGLTWTDPPASAPQLEATADGAITAGKPCIITTAGKAKQVVATEGATTQLVREAYSEQQLSGSNLYLEGGAAYRCAAYDPDSDTTMVIVRDSGSNKHVAKLFNSPSSGSAEATMTLLQTSDVNSGNSNQGIHAVCTLSSRRFLFFYYEFGYIRVKMATVNSSADGFTLSSSAHVMWGSGQEKYSNLMPVETTTNRIAVFVDSNNNSGVVADEKQALIVCDISADGSTWTNRSYALVDEGAYPSGGTIDYDSTNGVVGWVWYRSSNVKFRAAKIAAGTGAAITLSSTITLNSAAYRCACKYHSNSGSWITFLATNSSPYTNYLQAHTVNASTMAVTSGTAVSQGGNGGHKAVGVEISSAHALLLPYLENDKTLNSTMATVSGTTVSFNSGGPVELLKGGSAKDRMAFTYQGHNGVLQLWCNRSGSSGLYIGGANTTAITSNVTTENYIGLANSTVSDGATATIDVSGATNSSQSSLTAGQKYYVQGDGTLGLAEDTTKVFAGTAVSGTKIIVNDQQPIADTSGRLIDFDVWAVTSDSSSETWDDHVIGSGSPTAVNISRQTVAQNPLFEKIGTGMGYSSGVWTFPSTGYWEVIFRPIFYANAAGLKQKIKMELSVNGGVAWSEISRSHTGGGEQFEEPNATLFNLLNITNVSNQKIRFTWESDGDNSKIQGASGQLESHWVFKKIS